MASKAPLAFLLLVSLCVVSFTTYVKSEGDPQKECKQQCHRELSDERERRICEKRCQEEAGGRDEPSTERDHHHKECKQRCLREGAGQSERWQQECQRRCEEQEQKQQQRGFSDPFLEEKDNPYVWKKQEFRTKCKSEEGFLEELPNFAERSEILKGLKNYRVEWITTNPSTLVVPHHTDADSVLYVCNGKGAIGVVTEDKQQTYEVREGDIMVIPAGTTCFLANTDEREKLCILKIMNAVSTPGRVESFFGIGGEDQESFFTSFSPEILEASFNARKDQLRRLFGTRKRVIMKASPEQMKEISRSGSRGGSSHIWPFTQSDGHGPYKLLNKNPWFSNSRGQLYRADSSDYSALRPYDITVSFANVTAGSMLAPSYNSRATKIAIVTKGSGYLEMACPHISGSQQQRGEEEKQGTRYRKVSSELSPLTVFIEPAGHPSTIVANDDLHIICFDINSRGNHKYMLAGKNNIYNNLQGAARELAFGVSSRESEHILGSQDEELILKGPKGRSGGGTSRGYYDADQR